MTARLIDGAAVARGVRVEVARRVDAHRERTGRIPGLATVLVGDDPASAVYVGRKRALAAEAGIADVHRHLPADASQEQIADVIEALAHDESVDGILLQLPLPDRLDPAPLLELIPAEKDVDGLTTTSAGLLARGEPGLRPCTPSGVMRLLAADGTVPSGLRAVVVGRSALVGRPMAQMLLEADATVTVAHSRTADLATVCREADILIAAAGVPGLIGVPHVRPGAVVIDVGIHRTPSGLVGDVRTAEVAGVAAAITPVPGGVGPMTIAILLENTVRAAEARAGR